MERQTGGDRWRQTDGQAQMERQTEGAADGWRDRQMKRQTDGETERWTGRLMREMSFLSIILLMTNA